MKLVNSIKFALLSLLMVVALPVLAMNLQQAMSGLDAAKSQGLVGEQPDGYLGVVANTGDGGEIAKLINDARRAEYEKVAKASNATLADVEAVAGKKTIEKTQSGRFIQVNGQWAKKP